MFTLSNLHHARLRILLANIFTACIGIVLILWGLSHNVSVYVTPSQIINNKSTCRKSDCRLGAMVKRNSITWRNGKLRFIAQDDKLRQQTLTVIFEGALPNLFKEGGMMLAEGRIHGNVFIATRVLAKHDENYQPPS